MTDVSNIINIILFFASIFYISKISDKLSCGIIWVSFFIALIYRIELVLFSIFPNFPLDESRWIRSILTIINGVGIFVGFYSLHNRIERALRNYNGSL